MPTPTENWLAKHIPPVAQPDATATPAPTVAPGSGDPISRALAILGDHIHASVTAPSSLPSVADLTSRDPAVMRAAAMKLMPLIVGATGGLSETPGMLAVEHYSPKAGLRTLDPEYMGTGLPGKEAARATRTKAIHVYDASMDGVEPQFQRMYRYTASVPADKIYDIGSDDAGLVSAFQKRRGYLDPTEMETMLKRKGYLGFRSSESANPATIKVFGKLDVQPAQPRISPKGRTYGVPQPLNSVVDDAMATRRNEMAMALKAPTLAAKLHGLLTDGGGFTVDAATGQPVTKGYAVGAGDALGNVLRKPVGDLQPEHIEDWIAANARRFKPGTLLGGWVDKQDGTAYLEPTTLVSNLREAN